ncbi:predicted GTPase [Longilinea arvoryzae]|uniref:Predicted GTPase n=1 Tax=Longilinea arvoryzae TaxID=360412 RepID=A0A0S7BFQ1_9CHLR|nr:ADP-ribosylation factor-like protein [Longilinea arvoryzae]GAP12593.1 predicted GTPase [Longilinea arvoryzae]
MIIDYKRKQLNLKIVYYGPALSGKTTNLEYIHAHTSPDRRSNLVSLKTAEDRTLFFDFLQLELGRISGLVPIIQLYTVPGQTYYQASRKVVLKGADGIVFVADSARERALDNIVSWCDLHMHMREHQLHERTPVVIQLNKQDADGALGEEEMRSLLNAKDCPVVGAVAVNGRGVLETVKLICGETIRFIQTTAREKRQ